jgi:uncharacterized protein HemX
MFIEFGFLVFIVIAVGACFYEYGKHKQLIKENQQKELKREQEEQQKQEMLNSEKESKTRRGKNNG